MRVSPSPWYSSKWRRIYTLSLAKKRSFYRVSTDYCQYSELLQYYLTRTQREIRYEDPCPENLPLKYYARDFGVCKNTTFPKRYYNIRQKLHSTSLRGVCTLQTKD